VIALFLGITFILVMGKWWYGNKKGLNI